MGSTSQTSPQVTPWRCTHSTASTASWWRGPHYPPVRSSSVRTSSCPPTSSPWYWCLTVFISPSAPSSAPPPACPPTSPSPPWPPSWAPTSTSSWGASVLWRRPYTWGRRCRPSIWPATSTASTPSMSSSSEYSDSSHSPSPTCFTSSVTSTADSQLLFVSESDKKFTSNKFIFISSYLRKQKSL